MRRFLGSTYQESRDGPRLQTQLDIVRDYVLTHGWLTLAEISRALGYPEASVSARLRDLRREGFLVEREYVARGLHRYRVVAEPQQLVLV